MIQQGSRFADSTVITTEVRGKLAQVIVPGAQQPQTFTFLSYQLTVSDSLDLLAQRYYGDPAKWYIIADANPEIMMWWPLPVGQVIRIPTQAIQ